MLNIIWVCLIGISCIYGFATGRGAEVGGAFFDGAQGCVEFILKIGSFMILWQGLLCITDKSGLSDKISKLLSPVISFLFKGVKKGSKAARLISSNITANIMGLSNAATPLGIEAMKELGKKSRNNVATNNMCLLAVLNSASLQLVPSTLIALRTTYSSKSPAEITIPIWIVSFLTVIFAVCVSKFMEKYSYPKGGIYNS
ncbi:MAG: spore maturation protein [Clostridia bacterium]|nr:spore maturation protein [Clostridia bacterium]